MQPATGKVPIPDADLLKEVVDHYETADQFAREIAVFRDKVVIPAHNELRYAGHHVIQCIDIDTQQITDIDNLRKAHGHCERAMYEASEAGIMFAARIILTVHEQYPGVVISEAVNDYHESWHRAKQAKDMVVAGRTDRESVLAHTREYMDTFRNLKTRVERLDAARDDLAVKLTQVNRAWRSFILQAIAVVFAGCSLLVLLSRYW